MKVGDLVRIPVCLSASGKLPSKTCTCFFCWGQSSRIGIVSKIDRRGYEAMFDIGPWTFSERETEDPTLIEVINESR